MADPARSTAARRSSGIGVVLPLGAIVLGALLGAALLLLAAANEQNRLQLLHERELAEFGLHTIEDILRKSVKDYANWDEAFVAFGEPFDEAWTEPNLSGAYDNLGFDYGLVIGVDGRTKAFFDRGLRRDVDAHEVLGNGLAELAAAARALSAEHSEAATAILTDREGPVLAAMALVLPQRAELLDRHGPPSALLLMGKRLDEELVVDLRDRLRLQELRLVAASQPPEEGEGSIGLVAIDGSLVGLLRWRTGSPGDGMARLVVPVLTAVGIVSSALVAIALRNVRSAAAELAAGEQRFRDVALASSDWIFETDASGRLVFLSERFQEVTGLAPERAIGARLDEFLERVAADGEPEEPLASLLARPRPFRDIVCRLEGPAAGTRLVRLAARPIVEASGKLSGWRGTATDVTNESEALARARYLAHHDTLTGFANRARFQDLLDQRLVLAERSGRGFAVLFLDLDRFKEVNDGLGHAVGDQLLRLAAQRLAGELRPGDVLARLGGDEFAILVVEIDDPAAAVAIGRRLVEALGSPFEIDGHLIVTGTSAGVAIAPAHGRSAAEILRHADLALYRAKAQGRGQVQLFEPEMVEALVERQRLEADLRGAVERGEFELHYQPKFDASSGRITSCEALLRWRHPQRGLLPPSRFVSIAEETGLIAAIGGWVVEEACRRASGWRDVAVAVNLSPAQFRDERLVERVRGALERSGLPPHRLELEITESVLIDDTPRASEVIAAIKALGVRIAMDDFGTGYSSLAHLQRFAFDRIKIDRSFTARLTRRTEDAAIVAAIVRLARALGMTTCAEGVESPGQLEALRAAGCEEVQGYLLGQPLPADAFERMLRSAGLGVPERPTMPAEQAIDRGGAPSVTAIVPSVAA